MRLVSFSLQFRFMMSWSFPKSSTKLAYVMCSEVMRLLISDMHFKSHQKATSKHDDDQINSRIRRTGRHVLSSSIYFITLKKLRVLQFSWCIHIKLKLELVCPNLETSCLLRCQVIVSQRVLNSRHLS